MNFGDTYVCNCPIPFTGNVCQHSVPIAFSSQYKGNGYIELNASALVDGSNESEVFLTLSFSTTAPNGLLLWHGQNQNAGHSGQDFIAVAIADGFLTFEWSLNGEDTNAFLNTRVDDGVRHTVLLQRNDKQITFEFDNLSFSEYANPHLTGNIFIGKKKSDFA